MRAFALPRASSAVCHGHVLSRAELADMLFEGREGVAVDRKRACGMVEEGARLSCHHCQGVLARYYLFGFGCAKDAARSLALARASADDTASTGS